MSFFDEFERSYTGDQNKKDKKSRNERKDLYVEKMFTTRVLFQFQQMNQNQKKEADGPPFSCYLIMSILSVPQKGSESSPFSSRRRAWGMPKRLPTVNRFSAGSGA